MSEVYVVTCGCYSDYRIVAVYSDRDAADRRVAGENRRPYLEEEYRVEVWQLNRRPSYAGAVWQSTWWATETNLRTPAHAYEVWYEGDDPGTATAVEGEDYRYHGAEFTTRYVIVRGHSKEHVEKSSNDRRQQIRAELLGLT